MRERRQARQTWRKSKSWRKSWWERDDFYSALRQEKDAAHGTAFDQARNRYWDASAVATAIARNLLETDESARDRAWTNDAITWLEEDHFCRQSGFLKQRLHRRLRQVELNAEQANRLRQVILDVAVRGPRQELKEVARSARYLDSPALRSSLKELIEHPPEEPETRVEHERPYGIDLTIRQRAQFLLGACERPTPRSRPPIPS